MHFLFCLWNLYTLLLLSRLFKLLAILEFFMDIFKFTIGCLTDWQTKISRVTLGTAGLFSSSWHGGFLPTKLPKIA